MRKMVCGFLFSIDEEEIVLLEKKRPDFMKGRLNGIGGGIEGEETPAQAMEREFHEEAGLKLVGWKKFCFLHGEDFEVTFFVGHSSLTRSCYSGTDEVVLKLPVRWLFSDENKFLMMPNLRWLICMALDKNDIQADVEYFSKNNVTTRAPGE